MLADVRAATTVQVLNDADCAIGGFAGGARLGSVQSASYGGGEAGLTKNLFPLQKSTLVYRILHHTLIKLREMMISIS